MSKPFHIIQIFMIAFLIAFQDTVFANRFREINGQIINYAFKKLGSELNLGEQNFEFDKSSDKVVIALYGHQPLKNFLLNLSTNSTPLHFGVFLQAPSIRLLYTNISVTFTTARDPADTSDTKIALVTDTAQQLEVYFCDLRVKANHSLVASGLINTMMGNASITNTFLSQIFDCQTGAGFFINYFGKSLLIANISSMTVMRTKSDSAAIASFVSIGNKVINLDSATISGYIDNSTSDVQSIAPLVAKSDVTVIFNLKNSAYCVHGLYTNELCGEGAVCQIQTVSSQTPIPLQYIDIKSYSKYLQNGEDQYYGYNTDQGNNTQYEITPEFDYSLKKLSIFKDQSKFFNIQISGYSVNLDAKDFSLFVLDNTQATYKCITIFFQNSIISSSTSIYMLQKSTSNATINQVKINCNLSTSSAGRYVGFTDTVREAGVLVITQSSIIGQFMANSVNSTLGIHQVNTNASISFSATMINIDKIRHGGNTSVLVNYINNTQVIVFDNTSFNVANTLETQNTNGPIFGGFCQLVNSSTFVIMNSVVNANIFFGNGFKNSGVMIGSALNSTVTISNINITGSNTYINASSTGMLGFLKNCSFDISKIYVGTTRQAFDMKFDGSGLYAGVVAQLLDTVLIFKDSVLNYTLNGLQTEQVGFIGFMDQANTGKMDKNFELENLQINAIVSGKRCIGVIASNMTFYLKSNKSYLKNLTANTTVSGRTAANNNINYVGLLGNIKFSQFNATNLTLYALIQKVFWQDYCGTFSGYAGTYVQMTFRNYTSTLNVTDISGTVGGFGALIGELSGMKSAIESVSSAGFNPISLVQLFNASLLASFPLFSGTNQAGCIGTVTNASVNISDTNLTFNSTKSFPVITGAIYNPESVNLNQQKSTFVLTNIKAIKYNDNSIITERCVRLGNGNAVTRQLNVTNCTCNPS